MVLYKESSYTKKYRMRIIIIGNKRSLIKIVRKIMQKSGNFSYNFCTHPVIILLKNYNKGKIKMDTLSTDISV